MLWFPRFLSVGWALGIAILAESGAPAHVWRDVSGGRIRSLPSLTGTQTGFTQMSPDTTGLSVTNTISEAAMANNRILENGSGVALGDVNGDVRSRLRTHKLSLFCQIGLDRIETPTILLRERAAAK